jgi:hypothetical protein
VDTKGHFQRGNALFSKKSLPRPRQFAPSPFPPDETFSTSVPEGLVGRSASSLEFGLVSKFSEKTSGKRLTAETGVVLLIVFPQKGSSLKVTLCD